MQTMPKRIQRRRTKGWRMPENTVYVGRGSEFGNPFMVGKDGTASQCVAKYVKQMMPYTHRPPHNGMDDFFISEAFLTSVERLRGKNLACWCALDQPCHADWLLIEANRDFVHDQYLMLTVKKSPV